MTHLRIMSRPTVLNTPSTTPSCPSSQILFASLNKSFILYWFIGLSSSFFYWFKLFCVNVELIYNSDLLTKQSLHLLHPEHIWCSFSPKCNPKIRRISHSQIFFLLGSGLLPMFWKSFFGHVGSSLALSLFLFHTFFQFKCLASQLINPLLLCDFQIIEG